MLGKMAWYCRCLEAQGGMVAALQLQIHDGRVWDTAPMRRSATARDIWGPELQGLAQQATAGTPGAEVQCVICASMLLQLPFGFVPARDLRPSVSGGSG